LELQKAWSDYGRFDYLSLPEDTEEKRKKDISYAQNKITEYIGNATVLIAGAPDFQTVRSIEGMVSTLMEDYYVPTCWWLSKDIGVQVEVFPYHKFYFRYCEYLPDRMSEIEEAVIKIIAYLKTLDKTVDFHLRDFSWCEETFTWWKENKAAAQPAEAAAQPHAGAGGPVEDTSYLFR
jgi:hypothetical protein